VSILSASALRCVLGRAVSVASSCYKARENALEMRRSMGTVLKSKTSPVFELVLLALCGILFIQAVATAL